MKTTEVCPCRWVAATRSRWSRGARDEVPGHLARPSRVHHGGPAQKCLRTTSHRQPQLRSLLAQADRLGGGGAAGVYPHVPLNRAGDRGPTLPLAALSAKGTADVWKIRLMLQETFEELQ